MSMQSSNMNEPKQERQCHLGTTIQTASRCGSFLMFFTIFWSQQQTHVDAFQQRQPPRVSSHRIVTCSIRSTTRTPSMIYLAKRQSENDRMESSQPPEKSPTIKLIETEKKRSTKKTLTNKKKKLQPLYQSELTDHGILTAEEEKVLGKKIRKALALKEEIKVILEEREAMEFERFVKQEEYARLLLDDYEMEFGELEDSDLIDGDDDFTSMLMTPEGLGGSFLEETKRQKDQVSTNIEIQPVDQYLDDLWATKASFVSSSIGGSSGNDDDNVGYDSRRRPNTLSDKDLQHLGGREKVYQVLVEGAMAREKLISSNIRLALSVAKKWCQNAAKANGGSDSRAVIYAGSWTRPSLDEAVQEGIIGLATAADRFDYKLNLRFSTYATYWITNFVRRCFQNAATGGLRVPQNYHLIKQRYEQTVMTYYKDSGGSHMPIMDAANAMGISVARLRFVLKSMEPLTSLDSPLPQGVIRTAAGKSGGPATSGSDTAIGDSIACPDPSPEDRIEVSFLRQCLENAMSSELSPHERDVVRLRYGLDDGKTRTVKEISQMLTVTALQVRQAENSAFRKLRSPHSVHTYNLYGFLEYL